MAKPPPKPSSQRDKAAARYSKVPSPTPEKKVIHPITSDYIKTLSGRAEHDPKSITPKQVQELAASVQRHIEPRKGGKL
jgi:hypothetical protein